MIEVREPIPDELNAMYELRWKLLRKPLGMSHGSEKDTKEEESYHVVAVDSETKEVVGAGRLESVEGTLGEINYLVVEEKHQNQKIGKRMMKHLHTEAKKKGFSDLFLEARKNSFEFYKKIGYLSVGNWYTHPKLGIQNLKMELKINLSDS